MSIADKLQTILENEQKVYNAGYEKGKSEGGGGVNKLASVADGTVTELTAEDLAGATKIGKYAFNYRESLLSITIPNGITEIGMHSFEYCRKLKTVTIPESVTSIGEHAFDYCENMTTVNIPNSVTTINICTFYYCKSLKTVIIPDSVTSFANQAFYGSGLISIAIPNSVTFIGSYVFGQCKSLKRIDCSKHTSIPTLQVDGLVNNSTLQIKVPANLIDEWKAATNWSNYASKIVTEFTNEV